MLKVNSLTKTYPKFKLSDVSFELETGYIMGFIGRNGAGKSTTLKAMMNIISADGGKVEVFGKDMAQNELEIKQHISYTLGAFDYYTGKRASSIVSVYKRFYLDFSDKLFDKYVNNFHLDMTKRVREFSAGMKVKFALALALSHNSKLFIFDEPTSGLDPVARDELLDIFQGIVEDGDCSIIFSTHITSDLDKCADSVLFLQNGTTRYVGTKDNLIDSHKLISGGVNDLTDDLNSRCIWCKKRSTGFNALIKTVDIKPNDKVEVQIPNIEEIMVYYDHAEENGGFDSV